MVGFIVMLSDMVSRMIFWGGFEMIEIVIIMLMVFNVIGFICLILSPILVL